MPFILQLPPGYTARRLGMGPDASMPSGTCSQCQKHWFGWSLLVGKQECECGGIIEVKKRITDAPGMYYTPEAIEAEKEE